MDNGSAPPLQWRTLNPAPTGTNSLQPSEMGGVNRREFLSLMAASLALAGIEGCTPSPTLPERIVPYVRVPEDLLPGKPLHFATAMPFAGYGLGLVVKSDQGRPIKIEGNANHPASLGATDVFAQASLLTLYDPDRAKSVTHRGALTTLDSFVSNVTDDLARFKDNGGSGLRLLSGTITSPSEGALIDQFLRQFPNARWHQYEPVNNDNSRTGERMAFGRYLDAIYHFDKADVILSLDSDFLYWGPMHIRYTHDFAERRAAQPGERSMNRLYVFESSPTITGMKADHRIPMRSGDIVRLSQAIASRLGISEPGNAIFNDYWFEPLLRDLASHRGSSIVLAGQTQPPHVHALVHALNAKLDNIGKTVEYRSPIEVHPVEQTDSLRQLVQAMDAGQVDTLVMLDVNPAYSAPADFEFSNALTQVRQKICHSLYYDETAADSDWHVPKHHFLEAWGDVCSYDGTVSLIQPLIVPLYETKSTHEFLSILLGHPTRSNYQLVRDYWGGQYLANDFESFWSKSLQDGIVNTANLIPRPFAAPLPNIAVGNIPPFQQPETHDFDVLFRPDPSLYDGSPANNGWLLELPHPLTNLTWDNAVLLGPKTSDQLRVYNSDLVDLIVDGRQVTGAVWVVPGQAENTVCVHLGWGRRRAGRNGTERGFSAYGIRTSSDPWLALNGKIHKHGGQYELVSTRDHHTVMDRHMVRHITQEEYAKDPGLIQHEAAEPAPDETMYPPFPNIDYAWGMSVDLSRCVGCNACIVACQAENNSPVVGKNEVARGREMHWMRIDTYFEGGLDNPDGYFQPMFCQHCETAPCEYVCPVEATTHSAEGLNEMTYNRCIGTRYCSNNCPYKVRRFNFFEYASWDIPSLKLLYNPDVTVRSRGVMEKCTYCVQRINRARIEALKDDRKIRDGEILTACQQACPASALIFGNLLDKNSKVSKLRSEQRNYSVLADYNTRPRTNYLASLKNPNPELAGLDPARHNNG